MDDLGLFPRGFRICRRLQYCFLRPAFILRWTNALNLHARHALSVHFHNGETKIAVLKAFSAFWNKPQLVEDETSDCRVGRVFRYGDVVLCIQVTHVERGVKDERAIRQC